MEVHSSPAKQPASEALTASQDMWELAGEQQQSRSRGPGNNLRPAWGCLAACVLSTLLLPALQPSAFIAPLLSHIGLVLPGLGRWYHWPHAHISTMTPPHWILGTPVEETTLVAAGCGDSVPPHSARQAGDRLDLTERMESHHIGHLAGHP